MRLSISLAAVLGAAATLISTVTSFVHPSAISSRIVTHLNLEKHIADM